MFHDFSLALKPHFSSFLYPGVEVFRRPHLLCLLLEDLTAEAAARLGPLLEQGRMDPVGAHCQQRGGSGRHGIKKRKNLPAIHQKLNINRPKINNERN